MILNIIYLLIAESIIYRQQLMHMILNAHDCIQRNSNKQQSNSQQYQQSNSQWYKPENKRNDDTDDN